MMTHSSRARATITMRGTGNASVRVSDALDVTLRGTGTQRHIGTPTLTQRVAGTGPIRQRSQ